MLRKRMRTYIALLLIIFIGYILIPGQVFSFSERGAIKKHPFAATGNIIYEQQYDGMKVIVTEGQQFNSVSIVRSYWGLLHRVIDSQQISYHDSTVPLLRTWGGSLNNNNLYDTIIAVQVLDPAIVKVIVSNEKYEEEYSEDIRTIIANSTFFEVLTIKDGFAVYLDELESHLVGGYIFRGLNSQGEILTVLR